MITPVLHSICIVFDPVDEFKEYVRAYYLGDKESKRQQRETKGGRCCQINVRKEIQAPNTNGQERGREWKEGRKGNGY